MVISNTAAAGNIFDKDDNTDSGIIRVIIYQLYQLVHTTIIDGIIIVILMLRLIL